MSITFDEIDELPVRLNLERSTGWLKYERDAISKVEMPAPDVEGNTTEDDSRNCLIIFIRMYLLNHQHLIMQNRYLLKVK